jgi:hypothetical protein
MLTVSLSYPFLFFRFAPLLSLAQVRSDVGMPYPYTHSIVKQIEC